MAQQLPLTGIRVIALEQAVSAPFCSRQLADMGADVIKIERPDGGDFARQYDRALNGESAYFAWLNRGKRSITLNLKQASDLAIFSRLVAGSDIFVHNLAPGAVERLGFGYADLKNDYPELIWCGISGYGPDGPYRDKKAYDLLVQAEAGVVELTGSPDEPAKVGVSMADITAGLYAYSSILAALLNRQRTGQGERIDISMLECLTEWVMPPLYIWYGTGQSPQRAGMRHNMILPYGVFDCADGRVNLAVQNDREWTRFCEQVLHQSALASDPRFATNEARVANRHELEALLEAQFSTMTVDETVDILDAAGIANGKVSDLAAVYNHAQLAARGRWQDVETPSGTIPALVPPHNLASIQPQMGPVPSLGQHNQEVLNELTDKDQE